MADPERQSRFVSPAANASSPRRSTRREQRAEAIVPLAVCGFRADGRLFCEVCSSRNISRSGCRLHLRTQPQFGTVLALRVMPEDAAAGPQAPQCLFEVVWIEPEEDGWAAGAMAMGRTDLYRLAFPSRNP